MCSLLPTPIDLNNYTSFSSNKSMEMLVTFVVVEISNYVFGIPKINF